MRPKGPKSVIALHLWVTSGDGPVAVEMMTIPVIRNGKRTKSVRPYPTLCDRVAFFRLPFKGGGKTRARGRNPVLSYSFRDF